MFRAFVDWARLTRLPNALVAGFGVWLGDACLRAFPPGPGSAVSEPGPGLAPAALGFAAMALLAAAGNVHNDWLDQAADRVNRPDRPLVAGRISTRAAVLGAALLLFCALACGFAVDAAHGALTAGMALLLAAYNLRLKRWPLWGNLAVAALCALAVCFLEFPAPLRATALPGAFALLATLAREAAKDAEDMAGDRIAGWSSFPLRFGERATAYLAALLIALILALLPLPLVLDLGYLRWAYAAAALAGPAPLLLLGLRDAFRSQVPWGRMQRRLKRTMLAGMAAILAGALL
jgi:geranylgeranylglycerol-phosphate geranylgeranyltransferase